jgi:hypothetical protein
MDRGPVGWLGAGVAAGIAACAIYVWRTRADLLRSAHAAHAQELKQLAEDADGRVEVVIKQFEWAVADFARLRCRLDASEASVRVLTEKAREREHQNEQLVRQISRLRERLAEIAMAASLGRTAREAPRAPLSEAVYLNWGIHLDGARARLELQTLASVESPSRVRIMDRDGQIVAVSSTAIVSADGSLEFQVEPPLDLIVDLDEGREINYAVEALVEDSWKPVRLHDTGRRTANVEAIRGRLARVPEVRDTSRAADPGHLRRSALN